MIIKNILSFTLFISFIFLYNSETIEINILTSSENGGIYTYQELFDKFNKYSAENSLNIKLNVNLLSKDNSTVEVEDYESTIELLFSKKSDKYDLYYFDNIFSNKFGPYLLDLREYLSESHINLYDNEITSQTCYYNDKLVGLPTVIDCTSLIYNKDLLNKYKKSVPKTWEELIETAKYIINEEKKIGNDEIIGYNGVFPNEELGTCSLYEYLYSFRDSKESPFPDLTSQNVKDALEKLKKIKEEISSDEIFIQGLKFSLEKIINKKLLFGKFWDFQYFSNLMTSYSSSILPGNKEGVSGSILGGFNLGINKYIKKEKIDAAVIVFKYLTSLETQKYLVLNKRLNSAIISLYDDEEVCSIMDCEMLKRMQFIARPLYKKYIDWSTKFRNNIYESLFKGREISDALKDAELITEGYKSSANSIKSFFGIFVFIISYTIISILTQL
ncbi:periplasmic binding protein-like II [Neocallimastix lanati (nom. inval.)]|nr:periplasmic binding protein-like II [Neocallimastix sp. JGI-2020a]